MISGIRDVARSLLGQEQAVQGLGEQEFWALRNVSFELGEGEAIGILGSNGSGKSTLLRLIAGIYPPTAGRIVTRGRVGALIALGAGFHPHLSGRENVYINGMLLGISSERIRQVFDQIVEFAEIGAFIDAPVSSYSSGMTVRLGFAIAAHMDVDFLIADEVLAVGDLAFSIKCYRRLMEFKRNGGSILLVSHELKQVRNVCSRALWLSQGEVVSSGSVFDVANAYERQSLSKSVVGTAGSITRPDSTVDVLSCKILNSTGHQVETVERSEPVWAVLELRSDRFISNAILSVTLYNHEGVAVVSEFSSLYDQRFFELSPGVNVFRVRIDRIDLNPGRYLVSFTLSEGDIGNHLIWLEKIASFAVLTDGAPSYGIVRPSIEWNHDKIVD
jgi:lipopolysaccharide transport system ATP-binding protein